MIAYRYYYDYKMTESYCFKKQNFANIIITYIHIKLSETQIKSNIQNIFCVC